jgi:mannose-1-phosphate guanylyltransferase
VVTLGIQSNRPHTGYGYIQFVASENVLKSVLRFVEKPNESLAKTFIESGEYLWNAGIFIWSAKRILKELKEHANDIFETFFKIIPSIGTDQESAAILRAFESTRSESIDFAVMEHLKDIYTKPSDIGWSDLGTWGALYELSNKDENSNNEQKSQSVIVEDCASCIVRIPTDKKAIIKGLDGFVVAWEEEGLLIYPLEKEQELKSSLGKL